MDKGLDMALAHLKRAGSKPNPEHSDQQDDDGVDKKKKKVSPQAWTGGYLSLRRYQKTDSMKDLP